MAVAFMHCFLYDLCFHEKRQMAKEGGVKEKREEKTQQRWKMFVLWFKFSLCSVVMWIQHTRQSKATMLSHMTVRGHTHSGIVRGKNLRKEYHQWLFVRERK